MQKHKFKEHTAGIAGTHKGILHISSLVQLPWKENLFYKDTYKTLHILQDPQNSTILTVQ